MSWKYVGIQESNTKKQLFWQACPITQDLKVMISGHKADKINQFAVMPYLQKFIISLLQFSQLKDSELDKQQIS